MAVDYRLMRAAEAPAVLSFWSQSAGMSEPNQATWY
jgi:hypothetical protein